MLSLFQDILVGWHKEYSCYPTPLKSFRKNYIQNVQIESHIFYPLNSCIYFQGFQCIKKHLVTFFKGQVIPFVPKGGGEPSIFTLKARNQRSTVYFIFFLLITGNVTNHEPTLKKKKVSSVIMMPLPTRL